MSYAIAFIEESNKDMNDISDYFIQFCPDIARKFYETLKEKVSALSDMPYMYPTYELDTYYRQMVIDKYLLFYSVDEKRQLIIVHRIIHSKRDIHRQLSRGVAVFLQTESKELG